MKKIFAVLLTVVLLSSFVRCAPAPEPPPMAQSPAPPPDVSDTLVSPEPPPVPASEYQLPEGVDAGNFPPVDGSTAVIPLLCRIYSEICGIPIEEAEALITVSGTAGVWSSLSQQLDYDGDGFTDPIVAAVYECPEEISEQADFSALDIRPYGRDALVFLVNRDNPVESLTLEQLRGIYTGEITDWSEVGGNPEPIEPFQRNTDSGSHALFLKLLMQDTAPMEAPTEQIVEGMGGLIDMVSNFDGSGSGSAIGYSVFFYASEMYENPDVKIISVEDVAPSGESIEGGEYPLVSDFFLVTQKDIEPDSPSALLRDWMLSDEGARLMRSLGYLPAGGE